MRIITDKGAKWSCSAVEIVVGVFFWPVEDRVVKELHESDGGTVASTGLKGG